MSSSSSIINFNLRSMCRQCRSFVAGGRAGIYLCDIRVFHVVSFSLFLSLMKNRKMVKGFLDCQFSPLKTKAQPMTG